MGLSPIVRHATTSAGISGIWLDESLHRESWRLPVHWPRLF